MQLVSLKVSECYESETNPRGKDFGGKSFEELVASVKEKGVLVPVLARQMPLRTRTEETQYEIIAGNRRLRAAKQAGLKEIPAQLVEMTDDEAREAQIVENLQREDVHPLEEGEAYRQLIEDGGRTVKDVAVKVGKSETYVRQRLFLTNLSKKAAKAYRAGELPDSFAAALARLVATAQDETLKWVSGQWRDITLEELNRHITQEYSNPLKFQPWLTDADVAKAVGPCKECPPNRESLFGKVKEGFQCTDLRCWRRKMAAFVAYKKETEPELALVSEQYGESEAPWAMSAGDYELIESKKDRCDYAQKALVVDGEDIGKTVTICAAKECPDHGDQHTDYQQSPEEKERRKKEREKERVNKQKEDAAILAAIQRLTWPLSEKHLDELFELTFMRCSTSFQMPVTRRHGLKADVKKNGSYTMRDYEAPLRRFAEEGGKSGKLRMIFELLLPNYSEEQLKKHLRKL